MDRSKTSSTVMKLSKSYLPLLKRSRSFSFFKQMEAEKLLPEKITLSRNHNLDQSYLFGTSSSSPKACTAKTR